MKTPPAPVMPMPVKPKGYIYPPTVAEPRDAIIARATWLGRFVKTRRNWTTGQTEILASSPADATYYFDENMVEIGYIVPWWEGDYGVLFPEGRHWHIETWRQLHMEKVTHGERIAS